MTDSVEVGKKAAAHLAVRNHIKSGMVLKKLGKRDYYFVTKKIKNKK